MYLRFVLSCFLLISSFCLAISLPSSEESTQLKIIEQKLLSHSINSDSCQYYLDQLKSHALISQDEYWSNRYNFLEAISIRESGNYSDAKEMIESYINYTQENNLREEEAFAYFHLTQEFSNQLEASEYQEYIKTAKDVAAGAVLLVSIAAAIIGTLTLLPYIQGSVMLDQVFCGGYFSEKFLPAAERSLL